ncbi:MAG TPA: prepilin-type N-terminal cleavage/methylation domain-containing protein [Candidatus Omnitrophota bacterium]|nr:prepilin-type N-terminal cleavage/methylation domain-containing protein [Candidatus Omnitrophota bacterium]HPN88796.1 prepilin-type N-terminal cleavage/methylation domain-containing protein [Candidatus Omnitrophota bacterium]
MLAKTISRTGNYHKLLSRRLNSVKGFTFLEILVALMIFSLGVIALFRSFVIALDRMEYLTHRIYASILLDNRMEKAIRMLRVYQALPVDVQRFDRVDVGPKKINFEQVLYVKPVEDFSDIFQVDISMKWNQRRRVMSMSRAAYLADFGVTTNR